MPFPTEPRIMQKYWKALNADRDLAKAYFQRFGVTWKRERAREPGNDDARILSLFSREPGSDDARILSHIHSLDKLEREELLRMFDEIKNAFARNSKQGSWTPRKQVREKLSYYGGYQARRRLIESIPIRADDYVLDIGPETGMECFLLAEVYKRVAVAEPDAETYNLLRGIAAHYITEDGRKASDVLQIRRAGIIPRSSISSRTIEQGKPSNLVWFDASGALDIRGVFGQNFADRIVCHHLIWAMPAKPRLSVLLKALSSYCKHGGTITWSEEFGELTPEADEYAQSRGYEVPRMRQYQRQRRLAEARRYIRELLSGYAVTVRFYSEPLQVLTKAKRR